MDRQNYHMATDLTHLTFNLFSGDTSRRDNLMQHAMDVDH